jgi:hypothetical protein
LAVLIPKEYVRAKCSILGLCRSIHTVHQNIALRLKDRSVTPNNTTRCSTTDVILLGLDAGPAFSTAWVAQARAHLLSPGVKRVFARGHANGSVLGDDRHSKNGKSLGSEQDEGGLEEHGDCVLE